MTAIDTGAIRQRLRRISPDAARVQYPMDFTLLVDFDAPALCDALDAEWERTRVLREALQALAAGSVRVQRQWFRDHGMPEVADRTEAFPEALARAALAATGDGGEGRTP